MPEIKQKFLPKVPLEKLKLWDKNFRDIKPEAFERLKNKIKELGVFKPLLAVPSSGGKYAVIGGNQRLKAYRELGFPAADVILFPDLTDPKIITKIAIADNQSDGETDLKKLSELIGELQIPEIELEDYSVSVENISLNTALPNFDDAPEDDPADDIVPEVDAEKPAVTKPGDIWQLGAHRLICADATAPETYPKLLSGQKIDLVFTDPPYGVNIAKTGRIGAGSQKYKPIIGDGDTAAARAFYALAKGLGAANMVIFGGNYFADFLPASRNWAVWDKRGDIPSNSFADAELAWIANDGNIRIYRHIWSGFVRQGDKAEELKDRAHPTQKPVGLCADIFKDLEPFSTVLDAFLGSGTTLIACEKSNKVCFGVEIDPRYCDVIVKRFAAFRGTADGIFLTSADGQKRDFGAVFEGGAIWQTNRI